MRRHDASRWFALLCLALLPTLSFAHNDYERLLVFGDSLSDPGNAQLLTGIALTPPYTTLDALLVPDSPYAIGGGHFSNGPTWIEQLARSLELQASAGPAFANGSRQHHRRTNYAVGGARARSSGSGVDFTDQVNLYLSQAAAMREKRTLTVIEFGGNDVRDAIAALAPDPTGNTSAAIITEALTAISDNLLSLYTSGAREFLIVNSPDLSLTPSIRRLDLISPGSGLAAAMISAQFNAGLDSLIVQWQSQLPDLAITQFDIVAALSRIVSNPHRFRLANVTDACIMPNTPPYRCTKTKRYLFWDGIHPTKRGHAIFAAFAKWILFPHDQQKARDRHHHRHCRSDHSRSADCRH